MRAIVERGLERTRGNYKLLASLLNFPVTDYKRFWNFFDKHQCHVAFQPLRSVERPAASGRERVVRTNVG